MICRFGNGTINIAQTVYQCITIYGGAWTVDNVLMAINNQLDSKEYVARKQVQGALSKLYKERSIRRISKCWYGKV